MEEDIYSAANYTYDLPDNRIARYPLEQRDASKLLYYQKGEIADRQFSDITELLAEGDTLVINETRVINARLFFPSGSGKSVELFCLEPAERLDPSLALTARKEVIWVCLTGGLKPSMGRVFEAEEDGLQLRAEILDETGGERKVRFSWNDPDASFADILLRRGAVPLPPYLKRQAELSDSERYQTVYAAFQGSVAAPTAGLHFTPEIVAILRAKGVQIARITLHVGAGTFRPIKSEDIRKHRMHEEQYAVTLDALNILSNTRGRIIPIGTTAMRTLETLYQLAIASDISGVWKSDFVQEGTTRFGVQRNTLLKLLCEQALLSEDQLIKGSTGIMISPGYQFGFCDGLVTNFHQPGSTLILLVAAFVGKDWRKIYSHALASQYRFLSYGDSSLLIP